MSSAPTRTIVLAAGSMLDQTDASLVDAAADAGFDAIGLRIPSDRTLADLDATRRRAAGRHIHIHDTEVYRIGGETPDAGRLIDQTVAAGAAAMLVVSDLADIVETRRRLFEVTEQCRAAGVRVGLEYMAWTTPDAPLAAIRLAEQVGCDIVVDVLHHVRVGAGIDELDAVVASGRLGWVQVCDADRRSPGDSHHELVHEARHLRLPPGDGELPIAALLARVPDHVTVSVEVQSDALVDVEPRDRARRLLAATRSVLGDGHSPNNTG